MLLSQVPLARWKGVVRIFWAPGYTPTIYDVEHQDIHGGLVKSARIDRIEGEEARDLQARAIGAVGMLAYWPELVREVAAERKRRDALEGRIELPEQGGSTSGLILPPGVR